MSASRGDDDNQDFDYEMEDVQIELLEDNLESSTIEDDELVAKESSCCSFTFLKASFSQSCFAFWNRESPSVPNTENTNLINVNLVPVKRHGYGVII